MTRSPVPVSTAGARPIDSASWTPCSIELMGAHGMPASVSRANHSCASLWDSASMSSGSSSLRCELRGTARAKRSSSSHSGRPTVFASIANWRSLPHAMMRSPSFLGMGWYGYRLGCSLPIRCGTAPPATYALDWFTSPDIADDRRFVSTFCPSPVFPRCWRAARIPIVVCSPVMTSKIATPAR